MATPSIPTIPRRVFAAPDRQALHEETIAAVESNPQPFLDRYAADPRSLGGRYISADLVKETFPVYSQSREGRARYGAPLNDSANALAEAQLSRTLADTSDPKRDSILFATGVSGAGKSTIVVQTLERAGLPADVRAVYEGSLGNEAAALGKIQAALDAGLKPTIAVVQTPPEIALQNTLSRFEREGRTTSTVAMAKEQAQLPETLRAIHDRFGDQVKLTVFDRSAGLAKTEQVQGWEQLPRLEKEGTRERIQDRLNEALEQHRANQTISNDAYRQSRGWTPVEQPERLFERHAGEREPLSGAAGGAAGPAQRAGAAAMVPPGAAGRGGQADPAGAGGGAGAGGRLDPPQGVEIKRQGALMFWSYEVGDTTYKYAAGRLSVPGNAMQVPGEAVGPRDLHAQSAVSRGTGYDAGHLIGHQFGGPENNENLSLQSPTMNQGGGSYYIYETDLANRAVADHTIAVNICEVTKKGDPAFSQRHFNVIDTAPDGKVTEEVRQFGNPETEQARRQRVAAQQTGAGITASTLPARTPDKPIQQLAEEALERRPGYRSDIRASGRELGRNDEARGEVIAVNGSHVALATGANSYAVVDRGLLEQRSPEFPPDSRTPAQVNHDANARRSDGRGTAPGAPNTFDENKIVLGDKLRVRINGDQARVIKDEQVRQR